MADFEVTTFDDETFNGGSLAEETADGGGLSLREAIALANDDAEADTITFDLDPGDTTLRLTEGTLVITNALTIDGAGAVTITGDVDGNDTVVNGVTDLATTDAAALEDNVRLFLLSGSDGDTTFSGLTLTGGNAASGDGGAIVTSFSDITVTNSTISGNTAGDGGGIGNDNGVNTVTNSTISGNTAGSDGGGIYSYTGVNTVTNSTISGNMAGGDGGGIYNFIGDNTVTNSTISGNTAGNDGGGIYSYSGVNTVTNSTISGNIAEIDGGGIYSSSGGNTVTNSILTGNYNEFTPNEAGVSTLLGGNIVGDTFSIDGVAQTTGLTTADIFAETAEIIVDGAATGVFAGVLADNGGDVQTIALLADADNVAIDAVSNVAGNDARGFARAVDLAGDADTATDLGAFELQASEIASGTLVVNSTADSLSSDFFDDELTLREALAMVEDGGTITFDADVFSDANFSSGASTIYLQDTLVTAGNFTINGDTDGDGDADVVISGDANGDDITVIAAGSNNALITNAAENVNAPDNVQVIGVASGDVVLNGLVITGGYGSESGAISSAAGSSLTIENSVVAGNIGEQVGGIYALSGLTIRNTDIVQNTGGSVGGVAVAQGPDDGLNSALLVEGSNISSNVSYGSGGSFATGGIFTNAASITISDTVISDNTGRGLTLYSSATIQDSVISGNSSDFDGGGIAAVQGSFFSDSDVTLTIEGSSITGNEAGGYGGGIITNGTLNITSSLVAENTAGGFGGGLYLSGGDDHTLTNVTVAGNLAAQKGGAIGVGTSSFTADHVTITGNISENTSGSEAGVVHIVSSMVASTFTNSLIVGNTAGSDGEQISLQDTDSFTREDVDGGNNIISNDDVSDIFAETDTFDAEFGGGTFGVLADNGGDTETVALRLTADNAAIDGAVGSSVDADARGRSRSDFGVLGLGIADIGAFELINDGPVFSTSASLSVAEGDADVVDLAATDEIVTEGDGLTYSLEGGDDAALFEVDADTGNVTFKDDPNFEIALDSDGDNLYQITVGASDGGASTTLDLEIAVTDVDEAITLIADADGDTLEGSDESDVLTGALGDDVVNGGLGDDLILDPGGDDEIDAGGGDDRVGLLSGMNTVNGGDGDDLIIGGFDNDALMGGAGDDVIRGDVSARLSGSDEITGGTGNDLLEGRGGVDTFVFNTNDGDDTIAALDLDYVTPSNSTAAGADFVSGVDLIQLDGFGFADEDAALAKVTDVGGVATFSDQGTTITFTGLTADDLSADDFILV